jgi:hypothetical protein
LAAGCKKTQSMSQDKKKKPKKIFLEKQIYGQITPGIRNVGHHSAHTGFIVPSHWCVFAPKILPGEQILFSSYACFDCGRRLFALCHLLERSEPVKHFLMNR